MKENIPETLTSKLNPNNLYCASEELIDLKYQELTLNHKFRYGKYIDCSTNKFNWENLQKFFISNSWQLICMVFYEYDNIIEVIFSYCNDIIRIKSANYSLYTSVCTNDYNQINKYVNIIKKEFPPKKEIKDNTTFDIKFTYFRPNLGVASKLKALQSTVWETIQNNYSSEIINSVQKLKEIKSFKNRSKLIILNGLPGTGKTYLLRYLLSNWNEWVDSHFIMDFERMLQDTSYLMDIIQKQKDKTLLLVMEDADDFISISAKTQWGTAISRLLNLIDGMIGQGMDIAIIMTANTENSKLLPALIRPGRCLANLDFNGMSKEEAINWCKQNNVDPNKLEVHTNSVGFNKQAKNKYILADLYNLKVQK